MFSSEDPAAPAPVRSCDQPLPHDAERVLDESFRQTFTTRVRINTNEHYSREANIIISIEL